jgi:hypothetical protein
VVGVVMTEHHVGHVAGIRAALGQRGQEGVAGGDHARVDDDHRVAVQDQRDRAGHALVVAVQADVSIVQHMYRSGPARHDCQVSHEPDLTG